jgi:hypothetical protein
LISGVMVDAARAEAKGSSSAAAIVRLNLRLPFMVWGVKLNGPRRGSLWLPWSRAAGSKWILAT